MKPRLLIVFVLMMGQAFVLTGGVTAQGDAPPITHQPGGPPLPTGVGSRDVNAAVALGQPGLSFRYVQTFGITETAYISDTVHINRPQGLFIDASNNVYVVEEQGQRLLRYDSSGTNTLVLGQAGLCYTDNYVFCGIQDAAIDAGGNPWVADGNRVVQYSASGNFLQQFPATDPWMSGSDNTRFNTVRGLAFDSASRMFVSDSNNHRVQVFDISGGTPVYSATIGTAGVPGSGSTQFNNPYRLAVDSSNRLYVVDQNNNRVQRCTFSGGWSCAAFDSGLNNPQGIAVDGSNNVYIADTFNNSIRKCSPAGSCSVLVTLPDSPADVAVDSSGNVYAAIPYGWVVRKFNSSGSSLGIFAGVDGVPYLTDNYHYYQPRIAVDSSGNLIIVEELGQRLTKLNATGTLSWSVGVPGVDANDNAHFMYPHGVAVDRNGNIYVADGTRVQIFTGGGVYSATLGTGPGTGDYQFNWASGIAVDTNGNIYVSDGGNQRVQIYNSNRQYVATLGVTGVPGSDNGHFNYPIGIEVDSAGNIYVADIGNCRVQKFNSSRIYQMTFGTTGSCTESFSDVSAEDVTVDARGRVYISGWDNRVQVFDSAGAYLTTIGGSWGTNTSQFRGASGVAVDSAGNVYVADFTNGRIQKFSPGVPGWRQANINGFGDPTTPTAFSMAVFNNQLYAGATNWNGNGAAIWRTGDGISWSPVITAGFGLTATNPAVIGMVAFNSQLYAGTGWGGAPGQLWRSSNGTTWTQIIGNGLSVSTGPIGTFAVYSNTLYAATCGSGGADGAQIWRSSTGASLSWTNVVTAGNTTIDNACLTSLMPFNGALYAAVENDASGAQIWRSATGNNGTWTQTNTSGFGSASNTQTGGFASFDGYLYIGTRNDITGAQLWRSSDGSTWTSVMTNGFGDLNNLKIESLFAFEGALYAGLDNYVTGMEVWRSSDGTTWSQINPDAFGDSNNQGTLWSNETVVYNGGLYLGVGNYANGVEIWQMLHQVHLPLILK